MPLGISRSVEGVRLRQVQEAELAKSITEISSVKSARVHLALPEKSVFVRDQTPPTASVFVSLKNGRKLEKTQVLAITNLVSASVPAMSPNNVSIIDQFGNLLSNAPDDPDQVLADNQLEYRMRGSLKASLRDFGEVLVFSSGHRKTNIAKPNTTQPNKK